MKLVPLLGWGKPTHTMVPWRQGFRHPTRNECMGWFAQIALLAMCLCCGEACASSELCKLDCKRRDGDILT